MLRWIVLFPFWCLRGVLRLVAWFLMHRLRVFGIEWNPLRVEAWYWGRHDPIMRQGLTFGLAIHALLIFLPLLWMSLARQQASYALPKGSGTASVGGGEEVLVRPVKKQPKKNRRKFAVNPNSSIIFYSPDIDSDSKVLEIAQEETARTYVATGGKGGGKWGGKGGGRLGKGGGTQGGWPEGMEGAKVRFIRLQYRGGDWDYRTGSDADFNMMRAFAEITGLPGRVVAENIPIDALKHFPKNHAPPFVYITGTKGLEISPAEAKILRWYLLEEGGMLFADSGSLMFDNAFRAALRQACPELELGRHPQRRHHLPAALRVSQRRAAAVPPRRRAGMGLKHNDRWVVFYHPGDLGDAWRNDHAGMQDAVALRAFKLGVNIMNYAFNMYTDLHPAK